MMKITKEEKTLYKFLDIVSKIFGRSSQKTYLIGQADKLYFYTLGYCGCYTSKEEHLIPMYDFGVGEYTLKQLPNKEYVLDREDYMSNTYAALKFIKERIGVNAWQMEMTKDYESKLAKIAVHTNKWIPDDDLFILKAFPFYNVYSGNECVEITFDGGTCVINIILTDCVVNPDVADSTQLRFDELSKVGLHEETVIAAKKVDAAAEKPPEEFEDEGFEDEEDPMA